MVPSEYDRNASYFPILHTFPHNIAPVPRAEPNTNSDVPPNPSSDSTLNSDNDSTLNPDNDSTLNPDNDTELPPASGGRTS